MHAYERAILSRAFGVLRNHALSRAWRSWSQMAVHRGVLLSSMRHSLNALVHRELAVCWRSWRADAGSHKASLQALRRGVSHLINRQLLAAIKVVAVEDNLKNTVGKQWADSVHIR